MINLPSFFRALALVIICFSCALHSALAQANAQLPVDVNWVVVSTNLKRIDLGTLGVNQTIENIILQATGGQPPYEWTKLTGSANGLMPTGVSLSTTGVISGTPTALQDANGFKVRVTDSLQKSTEVMFILAVALVEKPVIDPPGNGTATLGESYSKQIRAITGKKPYTWSANATLLPSGLTLNASTGLLSGTPNATSVNATRGYRDYIIPITLKTGSNGTASANFTLTVAKKFEWVTGSALPAGYTGAN